MKQNEQKFKIEEVRETGNGKEYGLHLPGFSQIQWLPSPEIDLQPGDEIIAEYIPRIYKGEYTSYQFKFIRKVANDNG